MPEVTITKLDGKTIHFINSTYHQDNDMIFIRNLEDNTISNVYSIYDIKSIEQTD